MTELSLHSMTRLLTKPYRRGAEILTISLANGANGWMNVSSYDFREYKARYQTDPSDPRYILFSKKDVGQDGLLIELVFSAAAQTTLSAAIDAQTQTISVVSITGFPPGGQFTIRVDNEVMTVTTLNATTWTVVRGVADTIATTHAINAIVTQIFLLPIPPFTIAGTSFAIPLPSVITPTLMLARLRQLSPPLLGADVGAGNWSIVALLGNIAKLLWVIGSEKDVIHWHLQDIQQQRYLPLTHGSSLDYLGADLKVPRFPPREYSFDEDTLALYHLDDVSDATVLDEMSLFPRPGAVAHPGNNVGAQNGSVGRFATGFRFPGTSGSGAIEIPNHSDFDLPSDCPFTIEVFVKLDGVSAAVQVVIAKGQQDANGDHIGSGWSLSVGTFHSIGSNVRWTVTDGTTRVEIFGDLGIADAQFHHIAGIIDRTNKRSRLFVDGEEQATIGILGLGAVTNGEPIRMGRGKNENQLFGVLDEVRLSKIARVDFYPVLGEADVAYRQRLSIFENWQLPTPPALLQTINNLVQINGQPDSFVLVEQDTPGAKASRLVRILPAKLAPTQSIDRDGGLQSQEQEILGTSADDINFNPLYLLRHERPKVSYGADENNHRMQVTTRHVLDALLDLLVPVAKNLIIDKSFDADDQGLHSIGRALLLRHETEPVENLSVYAHRAGFDFVQNRGTQVYASVAMGEKLDILTSPLTTLVNAIDEATTTLKVATSNGFPTSFPFRIQIDYEIIVVTAIAATTWTVTRGTEGTLAASHTNQAGVIYLPAKGIDVFETRQIDLSIAPEILPAAGKIRWTLINAGAGRAHAVDQADFSRSRLRLIADAPGELTVKVEYTLNRQTILGSRTIRIGIESLEDGGIIAADGRKGLSEADAVGSSENPFNPIYLITHNVAGVNYGADAKNKQMQIGLEKPLNRLITLLARSVNGLQIIKAYDPTDGSLHKVGRALQLGHPTIAADKLGALAHQAGFGFVKRQGNNIYCSAEAGEKIDIVQTTDASLSSELSIGNTIDLQTRPTFGNSGTYSWSVDSLSYGRGSFNSVVKSQVKFIPLEPGWLVLNTTYLQPDNQSTLPYTFEIRLKPSLDVANTRISKEKYDLIMNILNYFHPIGIEVITEKIRKYVVELEKDPRKVFPAYTYPDFRT